MGFFAACTLYDYEKEDFDKMTGPFDNVNDALNIIPEGPDMIIAEFNEYNGKILYNWDNTEKKWVRVFYVDLRGGHNEKKV
jgi:hypothetical protein